VLWSESYDEGLEDVFAVQDRLAHSIVGRLAVRIGHVELKRVAAKPTTTMEAYDYVLRGREKAARLKREDNVEARRLFHQAIALDSRYAPALAGLGITHLNDLIEGWSEWPHEASRRAYEYAQAALTFDQDNSIAHVVVAVVHLLNKEHTLALAEADRAVELNPSDAYTHGVRGIILVWLGRHNEAIAAFDTVVRFDPSQSQPRILAHAGLAYLLAGRHEEAKRAFERSAGRYPEFALAHIGLAATYAELGKPLEAKQAAAAVRRLDPFFIAASFGTLFAVDRPRSRIVASLQEAGL
jgi:adenylate cyclase